MASVHKRSDSQYLRIAYRGPDGKKKWQTTEFTEAEAEQAEKLANALERRYEAAVTGQQTVSAWAEKWFEHRRRTIKSYLDDESRIRYHVLPVLGFVGINKVTQRDIQNLFDTLKEKKTKRGNKTLSGPTIRCIYAATYVMFEDARVEGLIQTNPVMLLSNTLPSGKKEKTKPYTAAQVDALLAAEKVPADRHVFWAILAFCGLRVGEGCALRWSDVRQLEPLWQLDIRKSYSVRRKKTDSTKTGVDRKVPVHALLQHYLEQWRDHDFEKLFGRPPVATDLLVPSRTMRERSSNHMLKKLKQDMARIGVPGCLAKQHAFRTTFISELKSKEVNKDKLKAITHGLENERDVVESRYTEFPWKDLCEIVLELPFTGEVAGPLPPNSTGNLELPEACASLPVVAQDCVKPEVFARHYATRSKNPGFESRPPRHFSPVESNTYTDRQLTGNCSFPSEVVGFEQLIDSLATNVLEYPLVRVLCEKCGREEEVQDGPGSTVCVHCSGNAWPVLEPIADLKRPE